MSIRQVFCVVSLFALTLGLCGCTGGGADKPKDSAAAIAKAKEMKTPKEQVDYLMAQAKRFITEDAPAEASKIAEHVMANFAEFKDQAAKLLEEAKAKIAEAAKKAGEKAAAGADKLKEGLEGAVPAK